MTLSFDESELERLKSIKGRYNRLPFSIAALYLTDTSIHDGQIQTIKFLSETIIEIEHFSLHRACIDGQMEIVKFLASRGHRLRPHLALAVRVYYRPFIIEWLKANGHL